MSGLPHLVLLGGDGGRSGVPRYLAQLTRALLPVARITVMSDEDRGGYGFAARLGVPHVAVPGLATSGNPAAVQRTARALRRALEAAKPDYVWANARMSVPLARLWAQRNARQSGSARLIVTHHGLPFGPGFGRTTSTVSRAVEIGFLRRGPQQDIVFLTEEDRAAFPAKPLMAHRAHVLGNCSDLGGFVPQAAGHGPRRLVMLSRDARQKNLDAAARVFAQVPGDMRLDLWGMGTDSADLRARFAAILPPEALARVGFCGMIADVRPILAAADMLLATSRYEGLSISMIEAMEFGLPIATTQVGGVALLAQHHPLLAVIDPATPAGCAAAAARIDQMTAAFRQDRAGQGAAIHAAWAGVFAPEAWEAQARALFARICAA